jgi:hypothetical protein
MNARGPVPTGSRLQAATVGLILLTHACAGRRAAPAAAVPGDTAGSSGSPLVGPVPGSPQPRSQSQAASRSAPEALKRLTFAVSALDDVSPESSHRALVQALRDLGIALAVSPDVSSSNVAAVLEAAQRLERAPAASHLYADLLKKGLAAALRALLARSASSLGAPQGDAAYRAALAHLGTALGSIRGDRPLFAQAELVAGGFRAATNAVYLASSFPPPFARASSGAARAAPPALDSKLTEAQAALLDLGKARWPNTRAAAAHALFSVADVIESMNRGAVLRAKVDSIRRQAERLGSADLLALEQTQWVANGLLTALDSLDVLPEEEAAFVSPWRRAAAEAIAGVSRGDTLAFQAGAVQDGFRATLAAFMAVSQADGACR